MVSAVVRTELGGEEQRPLLGAAAMVVRMVRSSTPRDQQRPEDAAGQGHGDHPCEGLLGRIEALVVAGP